MLAFLEFLFVTARLNSFLLTFRRGSCASPVPLKDAGKVNEVDQMRQSKDSNLLYEESTIVILWCSLKRLVVQLSSKLIHCIVTNFVDENQNFV